MVVFMKDAVIKLTNQLLWNSISRKHTSVLIFRFTGAPSTIITSCKPKAII